MEHSRSWIEISKENFQHNILAIQNHLPNNEKIIGVVKANHYGHGVDLTTKIMIENGINDFAVSALSEAEELRALNVKGTILILGYVEEEYWPKAYDLDCILTIVSVNHAIRLNKWAKANNVFVKVEIKVDTGMGRIGIPYHINNDDIKSLYGQSNLKIIGTYTHLSDADSFDENNRKWTYAQKDRFDSFTKTVIKNGYGVGRTHICASSGIINFPEFKYDYCRLGFCLLGYYVGEIKRTIDLKPILTWKTKIELVKEIEDYTPISYGRTYYSKGKRKIATLLVGYADGYPREYSNNGYVLIHGQKANIVGRICMDQMMIDVTDIPDVKCEDIVTLIGTDGNETISLEDFSSRINTIGDEVACLITQRVRRILR